MKPEFRLQNIIKEGLNDTFLIWKSELKNVFADTGVMIFFFFGPLHLSVVVRFYIQ